MSLLVIAFANFYLLMHILTHSDAAITPGPSNAAVEVGGSKTFKCVTDLTSGAMTWKPDDSPTAVCAAGNSSKLQVFSQECDYVISSAATSDATTYGCSDGATTKVAELIVVSSTCGPSSTPYQGQVVNLSCTITYTRFTATGQLYSIYTSSAIAWPDLPSPVASVPFTGTETSPTATSKSGTLTLPGSVSTTPTQTMLDPYNCTASFKFSGSQPTAGNPPPVYNTDTATVSCTLSGNQRHLYYCPTSATISPGSDSYTAGQKFNCSSDGFPPTTSTWTYSGAASGSATTAPGASYSFNPSQNGQYTLKCTATNNGSVSGKCSATSSSITITISGAGLGSGGNSTLSQAALAAAVAVPLAVALLALGVGLLAIYYAFIASKGTPPTETKPEVTESSDQTEPESDKGVWHQTGQPLPIQPYGWSWQRVFARRPGFIKSAKEALVPDLPVGNKGPLKIIDAEVPKLVYGQPRMYRRVGDNLWSGFPGDQRYIMRY